MIKRAVLVFIICLLCLSGLNAARRSYIYQYDTKIFFKQSQIKLKNNPCLVDGVMYVPLREIAQGMSLSFSYIKHLDTYIIERSGDFLKLKFKLNSNKVMIGDKEDELGSKLLLIRNSFYVPLADFLWTLGYFVKQDGNNYHILTKLRDVVLKENLLQISADTPIEANVEYVGGYYYITIPNSIWGQHEKRIDVNNGFINSIIVGQASLNPSYVKVIVSVDNRMKYVAFKEDTDKSYLIRFEYDRSLLARAVPKRIKVKEQVVPGKKVKLVEVKKKEKVLLTTGVTKYPSANVLWLPEANIAQKRTYDFVIKGNDIDNIPVKNYHERLYVPFTAVFSYLGCKLDLRNGSVSFTNNNGQAYIISEGRIRSYGIDETFKVERSGEEPYFPLIQTLKLIGYGAYLSDQRIFIVPRISEIQYVEENGLKNVLIKANDKLFPQPVQYLKSPERMLFDIPGAAYDAPINILRPKNDQIQNIRAAQFDKGVVRIVLDINTEKEKPNILYQDNGRTLVIAFVKEIKSIHVARTDEYDLYKFNVSSGRPEININKLEQPPRLVVDLDNIYLKDVSINYSSSNAVKQIRSSQLSWQPLVARVVFDLNNNFVRYEKDRDKNLRIYSVRKPVITRKQPDVVIDEGKPKEVIAPIKIKEEKKEQKPLAVKVKKSMKMMGLRVVIDAGHGGSDPGSISRTGYMEKNVTIEVAKYLQQMLSQAGAVPLMVREGDTHISMEDRSEYAIRNKADLVVSIHFNSFINAKVKGAEAYYYKPNDKKFAETVYNSMVKGTGATPKGLKKAQMYILNHTTMPGVLVEPAFISNREEASKIKTAYYQKRLAKALYEGIRKYIEGS